VAPLHWGLGHATRCVPIIHELVKHGFLVSLASDGAALTLLQNTFPELPAYELPSYQVRYSKRAIGFSWTLAQQLPHFWKTIQKEQKWLAEFALKNPLDGIISDNRPGLFHAEISSVYVTHQLQIKAGIWGKWASKAHQKLINRFDACWVPDNSNHAGLSGALGHPLAHRIHIPIAYIGPLSRLQKQGLTPEKGFILAVLSGPEPQRTLLENKLLSWVPPSETKALLIQGIPEKGSEKQINGWRVKPFAQAEELASFMEKAEYLVIRSGYSSLMDLQALRKKALLIPTPGQPEQLYLAEYMAVKNGLPWIDQSLFDGSQLHQIDACNGIESVEVSTTDWTELFTIFQG
jgi:predicted glycosyltransferase